VYLGSLAGLGSITYRPKDKKFRRVSEQTFILNTQRTGRSG
jgi:hypothetical protein